MPPNQSNDSAGYGGPFNGMHLQAGMVPPAIMPLQPMGPSPAMMSMQLQQQAMAAQYITPPPSAVFGMHSMATPGMFTPRAPTTMLGRGAYARQRSIHENNEVLGMMQGGAGLGARGLGNLGAGLMGGPLGMMAFEAFGGGQAVQNFGQNVFNPIIEQRERALAFQNASTGFVVGGSSLSASGQGMSMTASQRVMNAVARMPDSGQFRRETGGLFNREDMSRITRLSGELGMLDQSQNADQMIREVKKVSKALSTFMKIAGEPDIQKALQQMAQFRGMGFATTETPLAVANARTFARMAGVTVDEAMQRGQQGAQQFQQIGLSGAAGFNAGVGAMGIARQAATGMTARQLNMAGGEAGVAQAFMNASASANTLDAFLPAMMRREGGRLVVDHAAMRDMMTSGTMTVTDVMRRGSQNQQRWGREGVEEMITRRRELQDQVTANMSPEQMMLLPLMHARMIQRQVGGTLEGALTMTGASEQDARTIAQTASNPEFARTIRSQLERSARERMVQRRDIVEARDSIGGRLERRVERLIEREPVTRGLRRGMDYINRYLADEQDREEGLQMAGEGSSRIVRADRLSSDATRASTAEALRADPSGMRQRMAAASGIAQGLVAQENRRDTAMAGNMLTRHFVGPHGFGFTRAARGGDTLRSTVLDGMSTRDRVNEFFGQGPSQSVIEQQAREQVELGSIVENRGGTAQEQRARATQSLQGLGVQRGDQGRLRATAAAAVGTYVQSLRGGVGGLESNRASATQMRAVVAASLRSQGFTESQIRSATSSTDFMNTATQDARSAAGEEDRTTYDALESTGQSTRAGLAGQSADALSRIAGQQRDMAITALGGSSDMNVEERRGLLGVISGHDNEAELRRKLLAAVLLTRAPTENTRREGFQRISQLEEEASRAGKTDEFDRAKAVVEREIANMSEESRNALIERYSGKSIEQADAMVRGASAYNEGAEASSGAAGTKRLLGDDAADAYLTRGVAGLRENRDKVRSSRIREMLGDRSISDERIEAAIARETGGQVPGGEGPSATSPELSEEERRGLGTTEEMLAALSEGMGDFPGAVTQLDTASRRLLSVAERLEGANGAAAIMRVGEGAGDGFADVASRVLGIFGLGS